MKEKAILHSTDLMKQVALARIKCPSQVREHMLLCNPSSPHPSLGYCNHFSFKKFVAQIDLSPGFITLLAFQVSEVLSWIVVFGLLCPGGV